MKYCEEVFKKMTTEEKLKVVSRELNLETHNATTKDDLLMLLDFMNEEREKAAREQEKAARENSRSLSYSEAMKARNYWIKDLMTGYTLPAINLNSFLPCGKPSITANTMGDYKWKDYGKKWLAYPNEPERSDT